MNTQIITRETIANELALIPQERLNEVDTFIKFILFQSNSKERKPKINRRKFGCGKNLIGFISDDFNEPLEDFKEYME